MTTFDTSFDLTLGHEGGFQNDRNDRGNWTSGVIGKGQLKGTKYGISAMSYPLLDIKNLTLDQAKAIYKRDFWDKLSLDEVPAGLAYALFDAAVNHGPKQAVLFVQEALGVTKDGALGPKTLAAIQKADSLALLSNTNSVRALFYTDIGTFPRYKGGWLKRLVRVTVEAVTLDQSKVAPASPPSTSLWRRIL